MKLLRLCCVSLFLLLASESWADGCHLKDYGTLPVEMFRGMATTVVKVNGNSTRLILDTGAFYNAMSSASAQSLGLTLHHAPIDLNIHGVGGAVGIQIAHVKELGILDSTLKNVDFIVGGTDMGIGQGILSTNMFAYADLEIDLANGKLTLFNNNRCNMLPLAYWTKYGKYSVADIEPTGSPTDRRTFLSVKINGKPLRAVLDSGAHASVLSKRAAERIDIDLNAPGTKSAGVGFGIGSSQMKVWTVPIDSFSVGTETVQHSQVQVLDGDFGDGSTDMLLGVDFFLAHHVFIANSQKKVYFTYNGGRLFTSAEAADDKSNVDTAANDKSGTPMTALDYILRGEAHLSRGEKQRGLADLDEAIRMAPGQAAYYVARATARTEDKQSDEALADLDKSLSLDPKNIDALLLRAKLRLARRDHVGAAADVEMASTLAAAGSAQAHAVANQYVELDQPASALPMLDDWIRAHPRDAMLGVVLGERCRARGLSNELLDGALSDCRKAIKHDGNRSTYLDSLGMVQLRLGHYPEAIKAYEQVAAQGSHSAWSRYGLGLAKIYNGQKDAGEADLAAARSLDPEIEARAIRYGLTPAQTDRKGVQRVPSIP